MQTYGLAQAVAPVQPFPPHWAHCCATPVAEGVADETLVEVLVLRVVEVVRAVVLVLTVEEVCTVLERVLDAVVALLVLVTVPPPFFQPWISSSVRT